MTSTNIHVGYGDSDKKSSKVLKPPGGGTSDIFGGDAPATPRSVKNHMASNIFGPSDGINRNGGESGRRPQQSVDSHNRLFGETQRPNTPAKNYMKSNLPIGETSSKNGAAAAANSIHQNGNYENGNSNKHNGKSNGHSERNGNHGNMNGNGYKAEMNGGDVNGSSSRNSHHKNDDYHNDEHQNNNNQQESNNNINNNNNNNNTKKLSSNNKKNKSKSSPRPITPRNPVTGSGIDLPSDRPRKMGVRRDGNPVTGEGYKAGGAEINTTIPSLNGTNMVINKNRIPPGGYSSGLW